MKALFDAIQSQDPTSVKKILSERSFKKEDLQQVTSDKKQSALHLACTIGNDAIVKMLIEKGSPLDLKDEDGFTPLLVASSQRHASIVKLLLDVGADPKLSNSGQSSVLHYLIRTDPPLTGEQRDMLRYCMGSGCDINCRNKFGETPLHQACMRRHVDMCLFLLDNGAKVDAVNKFGETALHKACSVRSVELIQLLTQAGADPFIQSARGRAAQVLRADLQEAKPGPSEEELVKKMISMLEAYEASFQQRPVDLLEDTMSDTMMRVGKLTLESFSVHASVSAGLSAEVDSVVASRKLSATNKSDSSIPTISINNQHNNSSGSLPSATRRRKSIGDVDDDDLSASKEIILKEPSHHRVFGAIGSGTRRSRTNSFVGHPETPKVLSNSPQVGRLLRQASMEFVGTIVTPDPSFRIETTGFGRLEDMHIKKPPTIYGDEFFGKDHLVYLCGSAVVAILKEKQRNSYPVVVFNAKGFNRMSIPALQLEGKDFEAGCQDWIGLNVLPNTEFWLVEDAEIRKELKRVEESAPEASNCFRVGVVYCGANQKTEAEMFTNPKNVKSFTDFLCLIGEEIDLLGWGGYRGQLSVTAPGTSFYSQFKGCEIMYHVSNLLDGEQQRRLIGNDTAVIYFHDSETEPFPTSAPRSVMSQVFCVVKPHDGGSKVRVAFMSRKAVAEFPPEMPMNPVFDILTANGREVFRSFLISKLLNGYRSAVLSPPLDQMLKRPRQVELEKLVAKYPAPKRKGLFRR